MKNQLEDQLKNSFGDFEPEVDPNVWTRISSQLPAAAPQSPGTPGGDGGFLSSLGNAGTWLAASAAVVITGTALYFALNDDPKTTDVRQVQHPQLIEPPFQPEEPINNNIEENFATSTESIATIGGTRPVVREEHVINNSKSDPASNPAKPVSVVNDNQSLSSLSTASPVNSKETDQDVTAPVVSSTQNEITNEKTEASAEQAPLRLIVNTSGGFAPLSVTVLLNQTDSKGEIDFGDGNKTFAQSATHQYKIPGNYTIECKSGSQVTSQEIEVLDEIPSAFSPNGDGMNDVFIAGSPEISEVEIRIFNRQGRVIHIDKGSSVKWNGLYNDGSPAETGTYFYDIFVTSQRGNIYKQKGIITLFR